MSHPWDRRLGFWWIAEDHPEAPAIVESPDGQRTYGELAGDAHQLVHLFRSLGAAQGDVVSVLTDNGNTLIEVSLACQESGLRFTPLNTHLTAHELASIMDHSGAKVLVIGERFAPLLDGLDAIGAGPDVVSPSARSTACGRSPTPAPSTREPHRRSAPPVGCSCTRLAPPAQPKGIRRPIPHGDVGEIANNAARVRPGVRLPSVRRTDAGVAPACSTGARTATTWVGCTSARRW